MGVEEHVIGAAALGDGLQLLGRQVALDGNEGDEVLFIIIERIYVK